MSVSIASMRETANTLASSLYKAAKKLKQKHSEGEGIDPDMDRGERVVVLRDLPGGRVRD